MNLSVVCDWCDNQAAVSHPLLGNLCRVCLAGDPDSPAETGGHYQLRHTPLLTVCFAAPDAASALERLHTYLQVNTPAGKPAARWGQVLTDSIHDGTANLLIDQGVCVPIGGDSNVQLTACYCDDFLEP